MNSELNRALSILLPNEAQAVEIYAAEELRKYLFQIQGIEASIVLRDADSIDGPTIVLGNPSHHPALVGEESAASASITDGFNIRTSKLDPSILLITGDNGRGTLFGVYELIESWGVRFLLSGDILPEKPEPFRIEGFDLRREPAYPFRAVRPMANLPEGSAAWSLAEFTGFIDQMAKLKYNAFVFVIMESGPWLDYEFRGMERPAGDIFYGFRFPIGEDFIGKELFGGATEYYSPVLGAAGNEQERKRLGIELVRSIIQHCKKRGLLSLLTFSFLEPPTTLKHAFNEWSELPLPDPASFKDAHFTTTPAEEFGLNPQFSAWMNVLDSPVQELIAFRLKTLINSYPEADFYHLWVSEHRAGTENATKTFEELDRKYHFKPQFDFEMELSNPGDIPFPERFQNHMKADLLFLHAFEKILNETQLLDSSAKPSAALGVAGLMPRLAPMATKILPEGTTAVQFLDYGAHGPAEQIESLLPLLDAGVPTTLEIGVHDDNNMYFPQISVESLDRIVRNTATRGMGGYVVALWQVRQADINAAYLARASWDPKLTAEKFYEDFLPQLVGEAATKDFEAGCQALEVADRYVRKGLLYGLAFPLTDGLIKALIHSGFKLEPLEAGRALFQAAYDCFETAGQKATPRFAPYIQFWLTRTQLALDWLDLTAICQGLHEKIGNELTAGTPLEAQKKESALATVEDLIARVTRMIESIVADATHAGDLGQIANMNQHILRYLLNLRIELGPRPITNSPEPSSRIAH